MEVGDSHTREKRQVKRCLKPLRWRAGRSGQATKNALLDLIRLPPLHGAVVVVWSDMEEVVDFAFRILAADEEGTVIAVHPNRPDALQVAFLWLWLQRAVGRPPTYFSSASTTASCTGSGRD